MGLLQTREYNHVVWDEKKLGGVSALAIRVDIL